MAVGLSDLGACRSLLPGRFLIPVGGCVDPRTTMRSEVLGQSKTPLISFGNEPATIRFVA
jgi:hypothetical protein